MVSGSARLERDKADTNPTWEGMSTTTLAAWRATIAAMASQTAPNPFDKSAKLPRQSDPAIESALPDPRAFLVRPAELNIFHRNPRKGDVKAIAASLKAHDQYKPIVVNRGTHTGRPFEVLAGNHTLMAIRDLAEQYPDDPRWGDVLVHWLDVDDDRCNRIVAADNQTAQLGGFDFQELAGLLEDIGEVNLADIGFSDEDFADLKARLEESALDLPPKPEGLQDTSTNPNTADPDRHDSYEATTTRTMILAMPIPQFVWAQEQLAAMRADWDIDNNTDVVLELISRDTGIEIPDADAQVSADAIEQADNHAANGTGDPE